MGAFSVTAILPARRDRSIPAHRTGKLAWTVVVLAAGLSPCAKAIPSPAGAISAVDGRVTLDGKPVAADIQHAPRVAAGDVLGTEKGRAELLLNPGVFLRLAENSAVKLLASSPDRTRVELLRGEALLEVLQLGKRELLEVVDQESRAQLLQEGLYVFRAQRPSIAVFKGKARVGRIEESGIRVSVGQKKELDMSAVTLQPEKFDVTETDSLYAWSAKRTRTVAQTSESMAENLLALAPNSSYEAGWYWNPWFQAWAFVPGDGYHLSAFGYGFYAPTAVHSVMPVYADYRE